MMASGMSVAVQGFALGAAMLTFTESKLFGDLEAHGLLHAKEAAALHDYDHFHTVGLLRFLVTQGLFVEEPNETFRLTPKGTAAMSPTSRAAISFYIGGYGHLMTQSRSLLEKKITYGKEVTRDSYAAMPPLERSSTLPRSWTWFHSLCSRAKARRRSPTSAAAPASS